MRKYAFLHDNVIVGILDLEEQEYIEKMRVFQAGIDIEDAYPAPQIGWVLNGNKFCPVDALITDPVEYVAHNIYRPVKVFCAKVMEDFICENIAMGITQMGKTRAVGEVLRDLNYWVSNGSLYEAITEIERIKANIDPELAPFVTLERMNNFKAKIISFLVQ